MAIKQDAICNYLDVVDLVPQLYDDEDQSFPVLSPEQIREMVIRNDAQLRAELRPYYGDSISTTSPYAVTPVARYGNSANGKLLLTNGTMIFQFLREQQFIHKFTSLLLHRLLLLVVKVI